MKRVSVITFFTLALAANAQKMDTITTSSPFKSGNITVEVNVTSPFAGTTGQPFSLSNNNISNMSGLRFRYFFSETLALRLGFNVSRSGFNNSYGTQTDVSYTGTAANTNTASTIKDNELNIKSNSFTFSIMPGIEIHKLVSERLSVYYGGYVELTSTSSHSMATISPGSDATGSALFDGTYTEEWKGAYVDGTPTYTKTSVPGNNNISGLNQSVPGYLRLSMVGVVGADYYFTKGLYLGLEVGWGITSTTYKKVQHIVTSSAVTHGSAITGTTTTYSDIDKDKSGIQLSPYANASFRFGFRF